MVLGRVVFKGLVAGETASSSADPVQSETMRTAVDWPSFISQAAKPLPALRSKPVWSPGKQQVGGSRRGTSLPPTKRPQRLRDCSLCPHRGFCGDGRRSWPAAHPSAPGALRSPSEKPHRAPPPRLRPPVLAPTAVASSPRQQEAGHLQPQATEEMHFLIATDFQGKGLRRPQPAGLSG